MNCFTHCNGIAPAWVVVVVVDNYYWLLIEILHKVRIPDDGTWG